MTTGIITGIKRFAVHDGDGIRTTVFFKGCPLRCRWCHNPETQSARREIAFYRDKCRLCGACAAACPRHRVTGEGHAFDREGCAACGKCASACLLGALSVEGERVSVKELLPRLLDDRAFFAATGGGVTLSGGECLCQPAFCEELLASLKAEGISTAVDTCGYVPWENIRRVLPYTDAFLYDVKHADERAHIEGTGRSCRRIFANLARLDAAGAKVEIRIPLIPGYNDGAVAAIGKRLAGLSCVTGVRVLPYHDLARSKYAAVGREDTMPPVPATKEDVEKAKRTLEAFGLRTIE